MKEYKEIEFNIETLILNQRFTTMKNGVMDHYYKECPVKHKRRTIEGKSYNTKKSKLIFKEFIEANNNNWSYTFIYQTPDNEFFKRTFTNFLEMPIELIKERTVMLYFNEQRTLF